MIEQLKKYQAKHIDEILKHMAEHEYRFKRYDTSVTVALFYGDELFEHEKIVESIRLTDRYLSFEKNLSLLILSETDIKGGILAAEKVLSVQLKNNKDKKIFISIVEYNKQKGSSAFMCQLFNILDFSIKYDHSNEVTDSSYLDGAYSKKICI